MSFHVATTVGLRPGKKSQCLNLTLAHFYSFLLLVFIGSKSTANAQFDYTSYTLTNRTLDIAFSSDTNFYYVLDQLSFPLTSTRLDAILGTGLTLEFAPSVSNYGSAFFRLEQHSVTNDIIGDGIPDGFKLLHGLPVLGPSEATITAFPNNADWLEVYRTQTNLAALPLAYFPNSTTTVVVGASSVTISVALTKPFTGRLTYQLSGTAIPSSVGVTGDYIQPPGNVFINNATAANISIPLVPESDIEVNRSIVVALSTPATNQTYTITTNSCVTTVEIVQSTLGMFVGTLALTNSPLMGAQSVKFVFRPGTGNSPFAFFDVTGNAFLGNTFSFPVQADNNGFQLNGNQISKVVTNTPWGRSLNVTLSFGETLTNGTTFDTPVSMSIEGLTASGITYGASGTLNLTQSQ